MPSKKELLATLSTTKLLELAKENRVPQIISDFWSGTSKAMGKDEIVDILDQSRKVTKKIVEDKYFSTSKRSPKSKTRTKIKRKSLAKAQQTMIHKRQKHK